MPVEQAKLQILQQLAIKHDISQRELAQVLSISLGSVNYCLQALIEKGCIKMHNFQNKKKAGVCLSADDKRYEAKAAAKEVILWDSGTPKREFLYVDDLANALVFLVTLDAARYDALVDPAQCPLSSVISGEDLTSVRWLKPSPKSSATKAALCKIQASLTARCARLWMYCASKPWAGNRPLTWKRELLCLN